jgi:hypothetical protein
MNLDLSFVLQRGSVCSFSQSDRQLYYPEKFLLYIPILHVIKMRSVVLEGMQSSGRPRDRTCHTLLHFVQRTLTGVLLEVLLERPLQRTECAAVGTVSATCDICLIVDSTLQ